MSAKGSAPDDAPEGPVPKIKVEESKALALLVDLVLSVLLLVGLAFFILLLTDPTSAVFRFFFLTTSRYHLDHVARSSTLLMPDPKRVFQIVLCHLRNPLQLAASSSPKTTRSSFLPLVHTKQKLNMHILLEIIEALT